ncbi:hypothetical protein [Stakelama saccharophila]|uniref:Uncharacterized protein n=1 Tax=Stakelama saccharophila TaxID=3075605 RepID=A0ABZ0BC30_9SPHN|nr:hypothetical protein [Stakelama sp. W311]WNO54398.1 hypothetical protein RPR59_03840 [Stakelama sp. W311]
MADDKTGIDDRAKDGMSVTPPEPESDEQADKRRKETSIEERLERNPESKEARLDEAVEESMDASDPPATTQPVHRHGPAPSSGYDAEAERKRRQDKE